MIGGIVGAGDAVLLIGAPKCGKSALAVEAARCVSTGDDFFGRRVHAGAVVYVAAERFDETDTRLEVTMRGEADAPLRITRASLYADDDSEARRLAEAVGELAQEMRTRPALIILDTVGAMMRDGAGDENSSRDIGKLTLSIDRLRALTGAAVLVIHHAKRGEKRSRGSEALEAWADTITFAEEKGALRRLVVVRSNLIEQGPKATFQLSPIDLGEDPHTGARSSVVLAVPLADRQAEPAKPTRLPRDVETALAQLQTLAANEHPVPLGDWRTAAMEAFGDRKPPLKRQAFSAAKKRLETERLIFIEGESVSVSRASA